MSENELKLCDHSNEKRFICVCLYNHHIAEISRLTLECDQARTELKNVKELFKEAVRQKDEAHSLLGKERDEFGKKEIELMRELQAARAENKKYREGLERINFPLPVFGDRSDYVQVAINMKNIAKESLGDGDNGI